MGWIQNMLNDNPTLNTNELLFPGSHDSGAYKIEPSVEIVTSSAAMEFLNTNAIAKPIATKWSQCQDKTIYEQLKMGIHYLDLRIAFLENEWWIAHTFACVRVSEVFDDIVKFYSENNDDHILFMRIKDDNANFDIVKENIGSFWTQFREHDIFSLIFPTTSVSNNISQMVTNKTPIILVTYWTTDITSAIRDDLNNQLYADDSDTTKVVSFMKDSLDALRTDNSDFVVAQAILTPQTQDIVNDCTCIAFSSIMGLFSFIACVIFIITVAKISPTSINDLYQGLKIHKKKSITALIFISIVFIVLVLWFIMCFNSYSGISSANNSLLQTEILEVVNSSDTQVNVITGDFVTTDFCSNVIALN